MPILTVQLGPPRIRPKQGFGGGFWGSALVANRDVGPSKRRRPSKGREKLAESREVAADAWQVKKLRAKGIKKGILNGLWWEDPGRMSFFHEVALDSEWSHGGKCFRGLLQKWTT